MTTTTDSERRKSAKTLLKSLERELTQAQLETLTALERFGWELKFVRRKPFEPPVVVVMDGDGKSLSVLEVDGTLNENPDLKVRPD